MNTILVPVDGSGHAFKALRIACDLAAKHGGRIALLHVLAEHRSADEFLEMDAAGSFDQDLEQTLKEIDQSAKTVPEYLLHAVGKAILDQAAGRAARQDLDVDILPIERGAPAECILVARNRSGANTIVMGCRGSSRSGGTSMGSVSSVVFEKADCTCIAVK